MSQFRRSVAAVATLAAVVALPATASAKDNTAASRGARQLARSADTRSESVAAARALTVAGTQDDVLLETLTALVD